MEWFGLEGTCKGHQVQPPAKSRDISNQTRLLRAPYSIASLIKTNKSRRGELQRVLSGPLCRAEVQGR